MGASHHVEKVIRAPIPANGNPKFIEQCFSTTTLQLKISVFGSVRQTIIIDTIIEDLSQVVAGLAVPKTVGHWAIFTSGGNIKV